MEPPEAKRKFPLIFYIVLFALTAAVLALLGVWAWTKKDVFLYLLLGVFALYLFHLIFHLVKSDKDHKKREEEKSAFVSVAREAAARVVYLTYLGPERRVKSPSETKRDYLVEFYTADADGELLKRHLWFDLSDGEEQRLARHKLGGMNVPFPYLGEVRGRTLYVQSAFFEAAKELPAYRELFSGNEVIVYGE